MAVMPRIYGRGWRRGGEKRCRTAKNPHDHPSLGRSGADSSQVQFSAFVRVPISHLAEFFASNLAFLADKSMSYCTAEEFD
jgi:hypothetical protein